MYVNNLMSQKQTIKFHESSQENVMKPVSTLFSSMPYRVSIRSPMFITIPYASKCMIGYKVADIPAIMGSFDPCIGETDR